MIRHRWGMLLLCLPLVGCTAGAPPRGEAAFLLRPGSGTLRVMSYNINWDSIFPSDDPLNHDLRAFDRREAFGRILRAIQPDVLCLQEINERRSAQALGDFLGQVLGTMPWKAAKARDSVIASRFALQTAGYQMVTHSAIYALDQAAALVDLPDAEYAPDLYVLCAHFKSGGALEDVRLRGQQADVIMAHVRDFASPGGEIDLQAGTPFIILGDFNVYDTEPAQHLSTLLQGDIQNEDRYGEDLKPDWDASALTDASPSHNAEGIEYYTWRNDAEPFRPGTLDRILYSDSVLEVRKAFVLNTRLMTEADLAASGLLADDVLLDPASGYYDHLPLVADFVLKVPR